MIPENEEKRHVRQLDTIRKILSICPAPDGMAAIICDTKDVNGKGWIERVFALALTTDGMFEYVEPIVCCDGCLEIEDPDRIVGFDILSPFAGEILAHKELMLREWKERILERQKEIQRTREETQKFEKRLERTLEQ